MATPKTKATRFDRQANSAVDREMARERAAKLAQSYLSKTIGGRIQAIPETPPSNTADDAQGPRQPATKKKPWSGLTSGVAKLTYFARSSPQTPVVPHCWTTELTNAALEAADTGSCFLCLVWPLRIPSIAVLHALATAERTFSKDLRGLRTLLFPGTTTCRSHLDAVLVPRQRYSELSCDIWKTSENSLELCSSTPSDSFVAVLGALNNIQNRHSDLPNPALAELVPLFIYDNDASKWTTVVQSPLERTLRKVPDLHYRKVLREKVQTEWGVLSKAPSALLVLRPAARKAHWEAALRDRSLRGDARPELLLLDAIGSGDVIRQKAIARIPEFLKFVREQGYANTGALIVTDDLRTYFTLRARIADAGIDAKTRVFAAEAEEPFFSAQPKPIGWAPEQKGIPKFSVGIVDKDAASTAMAFHRLAQAAGGEDAGGHREMMEACLYLLRISGLPAGYSDLTEAIAAAIEETGVVGYADQRMSWANVELAIAAAMASGALSSERSAVDAAVKKAKKLIDAWADGTVMAERLLAEVKKHAIRSSGGMTLVLPNGWYVSLAQRYLRRKLGGDWQHASKHILFQTQSALKYELTSSTEASSRHYVFIGMTPDVLRMLLSHPHIPHGTVVLMSYKQAETTQKLVSGMKKIQEFKSYRGRIGLLMQELENRLREIPNPPHIERLSEMSFNFPLGDAIGPDTSTESRYTRFDLEGGGHAYGSGWVYRYDANQEPEFQRTPTTQIIPGNYIFDMSDELRSSMEEVLGLRAEGAISAMLPQRAFLKLYHQDVKRRCDSLFKQPTVRMLASQIHKRMTELDVDAANCRLERVLYWLEMTEDETAPHAARDANFFRLFCKALEIDDLQTQNYWTFVKNARKLNQRLGRLLAAQYAEILFHPENAVVYRKIPLDIVHRLQHEALSCVFRVERVIAPESPSETI